MSKNADTLERLRAYFEGAGVPTEGRRTARNGGAISATTSAVVLFPDDFTHAEVVTLIGELRRARPRVLLVVVTREPKKLEPALVPDGRSLPPLVLPRPSFGWSILDAIRAHGRDVTS